MRNFLIGASIIIFSLTFTLFLSVNLSSQAFAQADPNSDPRIPVGVNRINIGNNLPQTGMGVPAPATGGIIGTLLRNVIFLFFTVGGIATLIYFIWGAFDWITSGGEKEKVANARKKMTNAIIGLVLLSLSYFIVGLVGEVVGFNPLGPLQIRSLGQP